MYWTPSFENRKAPCRRDTVRASSRSWFPNCRPTRTGARVNDCAVIVAVSMSRTMMVSWRSFIGGRASRGHASHRFAPAVGCSGERRMLIAMEWELMLADAIVGSFGALIGLLIARRLKAPAGNRAKMIPVVCVVAAITLGQQLVSPVVKDWKTRRGLHAAMLEMYGNEESAALNTSILLPILHDPRFNKRIAALHTRAASDPSASLRGMQTGVSELVAAGLTRLDTTDLAAIFEVKRALAEKSPVLCGGFWSGQISPLELTAG